MGLKLIRHKPEELFTRVQSARFWVRVVQCPLCRLAIVVVFMVPAAVVHTLIRTQVVQRLDSPFDHVARALQIALTITVFIVAYRLYARWVERRPAVEMSASGSLAEIALGSLLGAGLVVAVVIPLAVLGSYQVVGSASPVVLLPALFIFGMGAFIEELLFRVIIFRLSEEALGTWISIALVATLFGVAHLGNENATPASAVALAGSDLLLAGGFVLTRRLWLVWGIHWGWNYMQDGVLGMANSGIASLPSWIDATISGPTWLTGGSFGIELSVWSVLLNALAGILLLRYAARRGQIVPPSWRRKRG